VAGSFGSAALQAATIVTLARVGGPETVGAYSVAVAVGAPVILFFSLQLRAVEAADASHQYTMAAYFGLRAIGAILSLIVILTLALTGYAPPLVGLIAIVGLAKAIESVIDVLEGVMQQAERMDLIAASFVTRAALGFATLTGAVAAFGSLVVGATLMAASWFLLLLFLDVPIARRLLRRQIQSTARVHVGELLRLAAATLPLGLISTLISLRVSVPIYLIQANMGESEVGVFAAAAYVTLPSHLAAVALGQSFLPRLARSYLVSRSEYASLLTRLLALVGAISVVMPVLLLFASGRVFGLLYGPGFVIDGAVPVIVAVATGLAAINSALGVGLVAARRFTSQLPIYFATALTALIVGSLLVPRIGLVGAGWALFASGLVWLVGNAIVLRNVLMKRHDDC